MPLSNKNKARIVFYSSFLTSVVFGVLWMKNMPGESYKGEDIAITEKQGKVAGLYLGQLNQFAREPRNFIYQKNLDKTADFIEKELASYGYEVNSLKYRFDRFRNIEVVIEPEGAKDNRNLKTIVIGAHYDSHEDSPGADDNGSAVVILLDLAKRFKQEFKAKDYRLRIVFFTNEEPPFFKDVDMGSVVYAKYLHDMKENVVGMYSFDVLGYFSSEENSQHYPFIFQPFFPDKGNFVAFIGNLQSRDLIQKSVGAFRETSKFPSEGVSAPTQIVGIDFSDHSSFYKYGIPALLISDTAFYRNLNYHTKNDVIENLNLNKMAQLTDALEAMFRKMYEK